MAYGQNGPSCDSLKRLCLHTIICNVYKLLSENVPTHTYSDPRVQTWQNREKKNCPGNLTGVYQGLSIKLSERGKKL